MFFWTECESPTHTPVFSFRLLIVQVFLYIRSCCARNECIGMRDLMKQFFHFGKGLLKWATICCIWDYLIISNRLQKGVGISIRIFLYIFLCMFGHNSVSAYIWIRSFLFGLFRNGTIKIWWEISEIDS